MNKKFVFILNISLWLLIAAPIAHAQESLADRLKNHVYALADDSLQGRKAGSEFAQKAADYIAAQWEEMGITPLVGDSYFMPFRNNQYRNVAAVIKGSHPVLKDEYIVVGAHYDHIGTKTGKNGETVIYNGADDNASGTAAIIELGRLLKEIQPALSRSVILITFDAEELGLYGSNEFADNPPVPIENVKLMFSVDMVGWYKTSGYLMYSGYGTIRNGEKLIMDTHIPEGLHLKTQKFERSVFTGTDTNGFAEKGVPTLYVTTGLKSPYHKPEDIAELIDYDGMALITGHLANLVQAVSTDENYQSSGKIASKHKPPSAFRIGISANIGSNYHHYTAGALDGKSAGAYGAGLAATINMGNFGIRPEAYYDFIQARHPDGKVSTHGITVPLNFLLQTSPSEMAGFAVFVGPYYSYKFDGKQNLNPNLAVMYPDNYFFNNLYYRNEAGLNYGFEMRVSSIRIGVVRRQAFTNFTREKNNDGAHIRNRSVFVTLSFDF